MKKTILHLFTSYFPYGNYESFLENELPMLARGFERIYIYPCNAPAGKARAVPANAVVRFVLNERVRLSSNRIFFRHALAILQVLKAEMMYCGNAGFFIKNIRHYNSLLVKGFYDAEMVKQASGSDGGEAVFYSFWMNDWALALAVLKMRGEIDGFVFRCGGFDIYDERHKGNYLPFRYFIYKHAAGIFPNSKDGERYIKAKNIFPDKVKVQYWGTKDNGKNPFTKKGVFTIVSCARIIPLKRIDRIADVLKHAKEEVNWIHFGGDMEGGKEEEKLKRQVQQLPPNVHRWLMGNVSNREIIAFYMTTQVNLFVSVSETESLPMSIQEAMSFGIPVLATDVGGVSEIVNEQTGMLIEKEFDDEMVAAQVEAFMNSEKNSEAFRTGVREYWKENFDAEKVYSRFCSMIKEI